MDIDLPYSTQIKHHVVHKSNNFPLKSNLCPNHSSIKT